MRLTFIRSIRPTDSREQWRWTLVVAETAEPLCQSTLAYDTLDGAVQCFNQSTGSRMEVGDDLVLMPVLEVQVAGRPSGDAGLLAEPTRKPVEVLYAPPGGSP